VAIGDGLVLETQSIRRHNRADWRKVLLPGQDVDDDIGGMNAVRQGLDAGRIDREQSVRQHSGEDLHHLTVTVIAAAQFAPDPIQPRRQGPIPEGRSIPECAGLSRQNRHIMPGIERRLAAPEAARMLGNDGTKRLKSANPLFQPKPEFSLLAQARLAKWHPECLLSGKRKVGLSDRDGR